MISKASEIEIKQASIDMLLLKIKEENIRNIGEKLDAKINQSPDFFKNASFILDLNNIKRNEQNIDSIITECNKRNINIIAVLENKQINDFIKKRNIHIINKYKKEKNHQNKTVNKIINKNIRSGQQIYAKDQNLIVFGNVSSGAEVIADHSITVNGSLRGRAIAGNKNDNQAFIIVTKKLKPELICINKIKYLSENLDKPNNKEKENKYIYLNEKQEIEYKEL